MTSVLEKRCSRCGYATLVLISGLCAECRDVMSDPEYMVDDEKTLAPGSVMRWRREIVQGRAPGPFGKLIACACGCGEMIHEFDAKGRRRSHAGPGHYRRGNVKRAPDGTFS